MRSQKLDAIRGCAIIGMVIYHAMYILTNIFGYSIFDFPNQNWHIFGRIVAITFIIVAGISFRLSTLGKTPGSILKSSIKRGLILGGIALLISIVTHTWFYEQRIMFGIIHFFALIAFISPLFIFFGRWNILVGLMIFGLHFIVQNISTTTDLLFPIGIITPSFYSADYYPLIPWFGYFLLGYGATYIYGENQVFRSWLREKYVWMVPLATIGNHALLFYILHPPIIYLLFMLMF